MSVFARQIPFEQLYYAIAVKRDGILWATLKEKALEVPQKRLEHLDKKEKFCVHRPKVSNVLTGLGNFLREWSHC